MIWVQQGVVGAVLPVPFGGGLVDEDPGQVQRLLPCVRVGGVVQEQGDEVHLPKADDELGPVR